MNESILDTIQQEFSSIWNIKRKGATLEIDTPFCYPNHDVIRVFLTMRDDRFIIADGCQLMDYLMPKNQPVYEAITHFRNNWHIEKFTCRDGRYYFNECREIKLIASRIFDLCHFLMSVAASVDYMEAKAQSSLAVAPKKNA